MSTLVRWCSCVLALLLAASLAAQPPAESSYSALERSFEDPPSGSRPRVWWHWMNGNVTKDGIAKDLEWMQRVGIGGLHNFDANLLTPKIVEDRLVYMTPAWKDAFRFAATRAEELGLELAIAASPGWSETGGPWVGAEDGMKKLVWSVTTVEGEKAFSGALPQPPRVTGAFQDLAAESDVLATLSGDRPFEPPEHYADITVLAWPIASTSDLPLPIAVDANGKAIDGGRLNDGSYAEHVEVARGETNQPTVVTVEYREPQIVRSLTLFAHGGLADLFGRAALLPHLEARNDGGTWREVCEVPIGTAPTTVSFEATTARAFRVVFAHNPEDSARTLEGAPGADTSLLAAVRRPRPTFRLAELRLSAEDQVHRFEAKAGFSLVPDYYELDAGVPAAAGVEPTGVLDLTERLRPDGTLQWTPPAGTWRVLRLGWSLTGKTNHPATSEATGLEVDKFDGAAVRRYLEHYLGTYREAAGADLLGSRGVRALLTDSIEVGASNWTPDLLDQFQRLRDYDPRPYLPALAGTLVGSREQSDAFLYDFRRTLADLIASEHYGTVASVAHERDLLVYGEALENGRPSLGDDLEMRRYADFPMAALWTYARHARANPAHLADMKGAASVAHLYGQNVAAAESMTSANHPWSHAPSDLRRIIDLEFAHGINRPVIHTSVHQPLDDKKPGLSLLIFGQFFNRHETWAELARPWIDYLSRSSHLLQQGRNVADVAYFYGEEAPLTALAVSGELDDVPIAYAYDFVGRHALIDVLTVADGDLVAPSGARYRVLYLGGSRHMTLSVLRRIAELARAGATIVGAPPVGSPSLTDDPEEMAALVAELWSGGAMTRVGAGRVLESDDLEAALAQLGIAPDFTYEKRQSDSEILFVHRRLESGDIYFVNNRRDRKEAFEGRFRVTGKTPRIWRADSGGIELVSYRTDGEHTVIPLEMEAEESFFVAFLEPAPAASATIEKPNFEPLVELPGPFTVELEPGRGAPASVSLASLHSLSEHDDPGVRYFSGVSTYNMAFELPEGVGTGGPLLLDLGAVGDLADVTVNGKEIGTVWHAPFRIDIAAAVSAGENVVQVRVANLWVNRLIGDAQPGAEKIAFTTIPTFRAEAPLRPSGLIGPVRILGER